MAKKKNIDQIEEMAEVGISENNEVEAQVCADFVDPQSDENSIDIEQSPSIPPKALAYLKRHPDVVAVYVDKLGGTFPSDTPKVFVKDAVLYNNPYFNKLNS